MKNKRQTFQKTIILDALKRLGNHPTPSMVYEEVHKQYPKVSRATVFRVLAGECDQGNAQRVYTPGGTARYEYGIRKHYHIICRECGKIADVEMPVMQYSPIDDISDAEGYAVENYVFEFIGLCPECQKHSGYTDKK